LKKLECFFRLRLAMATPPTSSEPGAPYDKTELLEPGSTYFSVHFSGCGFMLPFHFGVVKALQDHNIRFDTATGSSAGVMAALALLGGADLDLGTRQCFDLGLESGTVPGSIRSFFLTYRQYFRCFRKRERMTLAELRGRLFIQLARVGWSKGLEVFTVSDFESEEELEDAFMSACYIPLGTSLLPPRFRGEVLLDAMFGCTTSGRARKVFAANNPTLFPLHLEKAKAGLKMLVTPHGWDVNPEGLHLVQGDFRKLRDFWAGWDTQKRGFIQGYMKASSMIKTPIPRSLELESVTEMFEGVMTQQSNWKDEHSFQKPDHLLQCDPWMAVAVFCALLWIFIEERAFLYLLGACIIIRSRNDFHT